MNDQWKVWEPICPNTIPRNLTWNLKSGSMGPSMSQLYHRRWVYCDPSAGSILKRFDLFPHVKASHDAFCRPHVIPERDPFRGACEKIHSLQLISWSSLETTECIWMHILYSLAGEMSLCVISVNLQANWGQAPDPEIETQQWQLLRISQNQDLNL